VLPPDYAGNPDFAGGPAPGGPARISQRCSAAEARPHNRVAYRPSSPRFSQGAAPATRPPLILQPVRARPDRRRISSGRCSTASEYRHVAPDDKDMLLVEKATTLIQQVLADRQAAHEQMMGGNFAAIRKLAGG
jgi:hypothetical protein